LALAVGRFFLLIFETEFSVIQNFTHRCVRIGGNLNKVKSGLPSGGKSLFNRNNSFFLAVCKNKKDISRCYVAVDARSGGFFRRRRGKWASGYVELSCELLKNLRIEYEEAVMVFQALASVK
jgi:hypothetical protein